jgi:glutaminyl-tRNA synthetase
MEPAAVDPAMGERLQFERQGYFFRDPVDSTPGHPVFNRIVPLRDSWALEVQKQAPAAAAGKAPQPQPPKPPKPPKDTEEKVPEPLSAEELELLDRLRPEVLPVVERVLAAHPGQVDLYKKGKTGLLGFLIAQVMKQVAESGGKVNPKLLSLLVTEKLSAP